MQHPDEGTINEWLDGELSAEQSAELEVHVAQCGACAVAVAEARGLMAASSRIVSSLDMVPAGVIPIAKKRALPWYSTTQFRAAAAVAFVAGASLVFMRNEQTGPMARLSVADSAMPEAMIASVPAASASASSPTPSEMKASTTPAPNAVASKDNGAKVEDSKLKASKARVSSAASSTASTPAPEALMSKERQQANVAPVRPQARALSGRVSEAAAPKMDIELGAIRRTGVAGTPILARVRLDSTAIFTRSVYQVSPGVLVTLTETNPAKFSTRVDEVTIAPTSKSAPAPVVAQRLPSPPAAATAQDAAAASTAGTGSPVNSITWVSAVMGRRYTLTGPVSKEVLTQLRTQLPLEKR